MSERAIAYYRYSSHSQNEASIEQQQEAAYKYADAHGLNIIQEYEDRAASGTTADRDGYQNMLAELDKYKPSALILWKADRLGRDRYEVAAARKKLRDAGCKVLYVAEAIPVDDSPEGVLLESLIDGMADYYSKQLACNIKRGMQHNAEHGLFNGHPLFGYAVENKRYVEDPRTAPIVTAVFNDYADGKPMTDIARDLNLQGFRTKRGNKWNSNNIRSLLKNRRYLGEYREGDVVIPDGMPRLVSDEVFSQVQARFAMNKRLGSQRANAAADAPDFWLTGKLYCGECGSTMHGTSGTSKHKRVYYYYGCRDHLKRNGCPKTNIRKEVIEDLVIELLRDLLGDSELLYWLAGDMEAHYRETRGDGKYLNALEAEKKEVEKSIANIVKAIESGTYSETLLKRLTELEQRDEALDASINAEVVLQAELENDFTFYEMVAKYTNANFDDEQVRTDVLNYFIERIYLFDDRILITGWLSEHTRHKEWFEEMRLGDFDVGFERFVNGSTINTRPQRCACGLFLLPG